MSEANADSVARKRKILEAKFKRTFDRPLTVNDYKLIAQLVTATIELEEMNQRRDDGEALDHKAFLALSKQYTMLHDRLYKSPRQSAASKATASDVWAEVSAQ